MKNQNDPEIEFDHVGVAVKSFELARPFWQALGFHTGQATEVVSDQKVEVEMLPLKNSSNVELLEATNDESPIAKFIAKRGPGIHHLCFRVKNIDALLLKLKSTGVRLINETAVIGAHGKRVAFVHPASTGGLLIELSEKAV
jgi:methylmalonyl-CoA/ethylmalonyl-CoA epimerase